MKAIKNVLRRRIGRALAAAVLGAFALGLSTTAWADAKARNNGENGTWKFVVFGDHRGDNKAFSYFTDPVTGKYVTNGYTDGGINKAALINLCKAIKEEDPVFVLDVGDLATKYQSAITTQTPGDFFMDELKAWRAIWLANAGNLPIFPVRGNQEFTAPPSTWTSWLATMPGVGTTPRMGPDGGLTYAFTYKNCLFVALDEYAAAISTDAPTIAPDTLSWLGNLFAASDRPHVFVYGHTPAYEIWEIKAPKNNLWSGVMKDGLPSPSALDSKGNIVPPVLDPVAMAQARNPFWNLLESEGGMYFCGHEHIFARGTAPGMNGKPVRQMIIGNGGAPAPATTAAFLQLFMRNASALDPLKMYDPFVETDLNWTPPAARLVPDNFGSPRFTVESFDPQLSRTGYIVVEIHGSHAVATYKAAPNYNSPFQTIESWSWKVGEPEDLPMEALTE